MRTLREAAEALGVTVGRLRRGIRSGRYPYIDLGRKQLVDLDQRTEIIRAEDAAREQWIGSGEMCMKTGLRPGQLRRLCREGKIPFRVDSGGHYRFQEAPALKALEKLME